MLQYTNLPNGDIQIMTDTADNLVRELFVQFNQHMAVVPNTYIPRNMYTPYMRITISNENNVPGMINPATELFDISPVAVKLVSRNTSSFFFTLKEMAKQGYTYRDESAKLPLNSYSVILNKPGIAETTPVEQLMSNDEDSFQLDIALAKETKEELLAYCEKFGVSVDGRKTMAKIKNWLKTQ